MKKQRGIILAMVAGLVFCFAREADAQRALYREIFPRASTSTGIVLKDAATGWLIYRGPVNETSGTIS